MGIFSNLKDKFTTAVMGELLTDLGTLPLDENDKTLSLSIRQRSGKRPHLQVKLAATGGADYFAVPCSPEWADQFEKVAREIRKQLEP